MIRLLVGEIPGPALCRSIVQVGIGVALQSTLLLGLGLLAGRVWQRHLGRLRRGSLPIRHGDAAAALADLSRSLRVRPPLLQASPQVCSPCLTGLWRPAILLPASCEREFGGPALRALLAHELIHL